MISVLIVQMLSLFAYHGHGKLSHWQFWLNLSLYALLHYHHYATPVILCTLVLMEVCLGLHYLKFVFMYWNLYFFTSICIESCWYLYCVVLLLVLCCGPILLQMSRRSSRGKDIVADDPSTPVAKRTRLSSQASQDPNEERFRTPAYLTHLLKHLWQVNSYSGTGGGV